MFILAYISESHNDKSSVRFWKTIVVCNDFFRWCCDVIRGALGGAVAHRRQCVPNPRLHKSAKVETLSF